MQPPPPMLGLQGIQAPQMNGIDGFSWRISNESSSYSMQTGGSVVPPMAFL